MLRQTWQELKESFDRRYLVEALQQHQDKPIQERMRILRELEEFKKRKLYANMRAKYMLPMGLCLVTAGIVVRSFATDKIDLGFWGGPIGSAIVFGAIALVTVLLIVAAWRMGTARADKAWLEGREK